MATRVPAVGRALITELMTGAGTPADYVGWGTGATEVADGDTGLQTPAPEARVQGTVSRQTTDSSNDTFRVVATLTASAARAITEVALFTAASGGTMLMRAVAPVLNLGNGDAIQFTLDVQITSTTT